MNEFDPQELKKLFRPASDSHKSQNGKVMIIGGSKLFHAASLWSLQIASRIVDMVFYSSVEENNKIVHDLKKEFRNGIIVPRDNIEEYIIEADSVLIGPGMMRTETPLKPSEDYDLRGLEEIDEIDHEGIKTFYMTKYLLKKYPDKKWVIDAGSLQMMRPEWLKKLTQVPILTPHPKEYTRLFDEVLEHDNTQNIEKLSKQAKKYRSIILVKGEVDIVSSPEETNIVKGGNAGMTKGGTGDVLAGLVAALYSKNDAFLSACSASYINKKAGESLFQKVGLYFNASDLADEIPKTMKELVL